MNISQPKLKSEKFDDDDDNDDDDDDDNNGSPWGCYATLFGVSYPTFRRTVVTSSSDPENCLALSMTTLQPFAVPGTVYSHNDTGQYP